MQAGFIGTGNMGNPMARNLIRAGYQLVVHDVRQEATANLIELGAQWADSPQAVAASSEVIFTSLPTPVEVEQVLTGPSGILAGARPGTVYFDLTTNSPSTVRRLAQIAAEHGVTMLDSPVSGGVEGAEAATLAVMVGGDKAAFEKYRPLLQAIGKNVFHLGELGNGCVAKLVNNLISLSVGQIIQEGVVLGVKAGLDPLTLYEVMNVASASRYVQQLPRLLERNFENPTFFLELAAKDVGLAVQLGRELGVPMTMSAVAEQHYIRGKARGLGRLSPQATLIVHEEAAGVVVKPGTKQE